MRSHRLSVLIALFAAQAAVAQEATNDVPAGSGVRVIALSQDLADLGRRDKDALMLIVAADIAKKADVRRIDRAPEGAVAESSDPYAVEALLAEAVALGGASPVIKALADEVRASATKGRVVSKGYSVATLKGAGTDWYRGQKFVGGQYAEVSVQARGGSGSLDLFLYDDKGNLVCRDLRQSGTGYCGWTPSVTSSFDIKIVNRTGQAFRYALSTN